MVAGVMTPLAYLSATEAVKAFRRLELSPVDLLEAQIAQIEAHNGDTTSGINAFTETLFDDARTLARRAADTYTRCAATGQEPPPLLGLTVATKEKHGIAGLRLEQG